LYIPKAKRTKLKSQNQYGITDKHGKVRKNHDSSTPLQGVYISKLYKIYSFWVRHSTFALTNATFIGTVVARAGRKKAKIDRRVSAGITPE